MKGPVVNQQTLPQEASLAPPVEAHPISRRWPMRRIAWACFLCGQGVSYEAIATDPWVRSSAASVRRQLNRLGVRIRDVVGGDVRFNASKAAFAVFEVAAARRGVTPAELMRRTVEILGRDAALLDNVLDDQN